MSIKKIITLYGGENKVTILEYFKFLLEKELIFFTSTPNLFPKIDFTKWKCPSKIYQAIIDFENDFTISKQTIKSLEHLNCKFLQLRFYNEIPYLTLNNLLNKFENCSIIGIDIYLKFVSDKEVSSILELTNYYQRINNIVISGAPVNKQIALRKKSDSANVALIKQSIGSCKNCGVISPNYFTTNIEAYTESLNHNSCLNQKISIDKNGEIKNCPSMSKSFGNIKNTLLEEVLNKSDFKKLWNVKKDEIEGCKDCEFRHICTDCRAYTEDPDDIYSKPLKCGYDPYTGKWEKWSTNPIKNEAIEYYKLKEINS